MVILPPWSRRRWRARARKRRFVVKNKNQLFQPLALGLTGRGLRIELLWRASTTKVWKYLGQEVPFRQKMFDALASSSSSLPRSLRAVLLTSKKQLFSRCSQHQQQQQKLLQEKGEQTTSRGGAQRERKTSFDIFWQVEIIEIYLSYKCFDRIPPSVRETFFNIKSFRHFFS